MTRDEALDELRKLPAMTLEAIAVAIETRPLRFSPMPAAENDLARVLAGREQFRLCLAAEIRSLITEPSP